MFQPPPTPSTSRQGDRVFFLVLRFMRRPILTLVVVYAISMVGWVMIPGPVIGGEPKTIGLFHAFYFLTYTATTTGFGEIPFPFTEAQRMWAIVSLYAGVVAWLYAVGAIVGLIQDPRFRQALSERRFARTVARMAEPFVILCGFGNTGSLLTRGLSDAGLAAVILDVDPDRVMAIYLRDYRVAMHALCADARVPAHLIDAGLRKPNCLAVVALTREEEANLKIAVTARLLNPNVRVITLSTSAAYEETLATLGADIHIVDPFLTYARYLSASIHNPIFHMLNDWLVGAPFANLAMYPYMPRGKWVLCGYGRMGRAIHASLAELGIEVSVIDPNIDPSQVTHGRYVAGRGTQQHLLDAGIRDAAGIVVGTNRDPENLSIVLNARALNPNIFIIVRQNRHRNEVVFNAADADLIMQPSLVTARRMLFLLIAPLVKTFFERVRACSSEIEDAFLKETIEVLRTRVGGSRPRLWTVVVGPETAGALCRMREAGGEVALGDVLRSPHNREQMLACVPLVHESDAGVAVMPPFDAPLRVGDTVLLCGTNSAHWTLDATLNNDYTLGYLVTGIEETRSIVLRWLLGRRSDGVPEALR